MTSDQFYQIGLQGKCPSCGGSNLSKFPASEAGGIPSYACSDCGGFPALCNSTVYISNDRQNCPICGEHKPDGMTHMLLQYIS